MAFPMNGLMVYYTFRNVIIKLHTHYYFRGYQQKLNGL